MAYPQLADGGDGLHILKEIAKVVNKQWRTAVEKGWLFSFGVGREDDNFYHKNTQYLELYLAEACTTHGCYTKCLQSFDQ
jgi:hypothetical protein